MSLALAELEEPRLLARPVGQDDGEGVESALRASMRARESATTARGDVRPAAMASTVSAALRGVSVTRAA